MTNSAANDQLNHSITELVSNFATASDSTESISTNQDATDSQPTVTFTDFDLPQPLFTALDKLGFSSPTPVQEQTLNSALEGNDLMVSAQTGSGKTVAFLLPCLVQVINNLPPAHSRHKKARPQVLVICPTRELVQQVFQDAVNLLKHTKGVRVASVMGGMSYNKQISGLKGAQIVIATPGRLLDLESRNNIQLNHVTHMVLDEADRMLDLGFSEDLASIAKHCEQREQTLLFSATFADNIVHLAERLMDSPQRIELANSQDKHADITQALYWADDEDHKQALLMHWLEHEPIEQAVIFAPTQVETERLAFALRKADYSVVDLHGGMRQFMRMKQIKKLRDGKAKILVATDVAARGLDVPSISHVINYGIPMKNEDYVHRIGRTGRAGRQGHAITVATHSDRRKVFALQHFLKQDIEVLEVEGLEPTPYQPRHNKKNNRRRGKPRPNASERRFERDKNRHNNHGKRDNSGHNSHFEKSAQSYKKRHNNDEKSNQQSHGDKYKGHKQSYHAGNEKPYGKRDAWKKDGFKKDGFKKDGFKKDGSKKDHVRKDHGNQNGFRKEGFKKDGSKKDGFKRDDWKKKDSSKQGGWKKNENWNGKKGGQHSKTGNASHKPYHSNKNRHHVNEEVFANNKGSEDGHKPVFKKKSPKNRKNREGLYRSK